MEVKVLSSKLIKPAHDAAAVPATYVPLSVFDRVTCQIPMTLIYAFAAPAPSTADIEKGLAVALARYRTFAGQLGQAPDGTPAVVLNDRGARLVEACVLDTDLADMAAGQPTPELLKLHPYLDAELEEVALVQLTRFRCGSLAVGFTSNHAVADAHATSNFLVAWGGAARGLPPNQAMGLSTPVYHRGEFLMPRTPPRVEYNHRSREYYLPSRSPAANNGYNAYSASTVVIHKAHLSKDFIVALRAKASGGGVPFSRFETIVAHVWRAMTRARRPTDLSQVSTIRISVDGRPRLGGVAEEYFGNLVLWAFPRATVGDLLSQPLKHTAQAIHDEVATVADAAYFRSFVDFACSGAVEEEGLAPSNVLKHVLCPDMEVDSWLTFPFYDLDFGTGSPSWLTPSYFTSEGVLYLAPSSIGDGSVDAFVHVFQHNLHVFKQCCYSME